MSSTKDGFVCMLTFSYAFLHHLPIKYVAWVSCSIECKRLTYTKRNLDSCSHRLDVQYLE